MRYQRSAGNLMPSPPSVVTSHLEFRSVSGVRVSAVARHENSATRFRTPRQSISIGGVVLLTGRAVNDAHGIIHLFSALPFPISRSRAARRSARAGQLRAPMKPIAVDQFTQDALPDAWKEGKASAIALSAALATLTGHPVPVGHCVRNVFAHHHPPQVCEDFQMRAMTRLAEVKPVSAERASTSQIPSRESLTTYSTNRKPSGAAQEHAHGDCR